MPTIKTNLGDRSYKIIIGDKLGATANRELERVRQDGRLWTVYDAQLYALHGPALKKRLPTLKVGQRELVIPSGEDSKSIRTVEQLHSFFLSEKISRSDVIVAVGGGALTDLVGFVAATILRGVRWVTIPSTLLGMVDAAIGGKTGVNHPLGKNLIGAIWQPALVLCDLDLLKTLSPHQFLCGMGEVIKYAGLTGPEMISDSHRYLDDGLPAGGSPLTRLVTESARFKAAVVTQDERESDLRMILNLGHTFGHGIERALNYKRLMHGEAVTLGLLAAVNLSLLTGLAKEKDLADYEALIRKAIKLLPKVKIDPKAAIDGMALDKKRSSHSLRFVLLKKPGQPIIIDKVEPRLYSAAMRHALSVYHG